MQRFRGSSASSAVYCMYVYVLYVSVCVLAESFYLCVFIETFTKQ